MSTQAAHVTVAHDARPFLPRVAGFFFSFQLVIVLIAVRAFFMEPQTGAALCVVISMLLLAATMLHSAGPAPQTLRSIWQAPCLRWVILFLTFSLCSFAWTSAASVSNAMAYWCMLAASVILVLLLLRTGPLEAVTSTLLEGYVLGACTVALIAYILPAQSDLRLGDEELLGANQIAYVCAFAIFLAQYLIYRGYKGWRYPAIFLSITVLRTLSKTTIAALVVGEAFLLLHDRSINRKTKIAIVAGACVVIALFWSLLSAYYTLYTNTGNSPETLTGRIGIWAVILGLSLDQPWIGHGFYSVWKVVPSFGDFEARHAHNELLQQFYCYGAMGILMLAGLYGSLYRQARRLPTGHVRTLLLAMLLFVLVRGFADTEVFDVSFPLWALTLFSVTLQRSQGLRQHERKITPITASLLQSKVGCP